MTDTATAAPLTLSSLRRGEKARVIGVATHLGPALCRRLGDLGFVTDSAVECIRRAPFGNPVVYGVGNSEMCLRDDLASCVLIERLTADLATARPSLTGKGN
jgi:ferrous iron transport protein A